MRLPVHCRRSRKDAAGLSQEARDALAKAAAEVTRAAESLRRHAAATARNVVQRAAHEVHEHPIASLAGRHYRSRRAGQCALGRMPEKPRIVIHRLDENTVTN